MHWHVGGTKGRMAERLGAFPKGKRDTMSLTWSTTERLRLPALEFLISRKLASIALPNCEEPPLSNIYDGVLGEDRRFSLDHMAAAAGNVPTWLFIRTGGVEKREFDIVSLAMDAWHKRPLPIVDRARRAGPLSRHLRAVSASSCTRPEELLTLLGHVTR